MTTYTFKSNKFHKLWKRLAVKVLIEDMAEQLRNLNLLLSKRLSQYYITKIYVQFIKIY